MKDIVNPFTVRTPEDIEACDALKLWVDVFTDFYKIRDTGHSMLNGPRGCGKSMMFRFLQADCQCLQRKCGLRDLPFFSVLVSIKNTDLNLTDLQRLAEEHGNAILNEHFLVMYVASKTFLELSARVSIPDTEENRHAATSFAQRFHNHLRVSGWKEDMPSSNADAPPVEVFRALCRLCDSLYNRVIAYVRQLAYPSSTPVSYEGPLCGYLDFLYPVLEDFRGLPFMPKGPIYLLIDDADYLNLIQTKVLNSWLSTRTSANVSIKVSTQLKYKTFLTVSDMRISSPHDYSEINIADIYTSSRSKYIRMVEEIVRKRLRMAGLRGIKPCDFFPGDAEQERQIEEIKQQLKSDWESSGRGYRPSDDALRYARPTFIARLKGVRKSGSSYSYAGFEQLVHISSGLIRFFLEPAALMFGEELAQSEKKRITSIRPSIQNRVIREEASKLMLTEFDNIFKDEEKQIDKSQQGILNEQKRKLQALLKVLGGLFHAKLISQDAERRVFSLAFSDVPGQDLEDLLDLGIRYGYFDRTTIGNKDGTGRTSLYILTRRLAPYFFLDPCGFAGYLFVTSARLREAISNPDKFLRAIEKRGVDDAFEERQMLLFE